MVSRTIDELIGYGLEAGLIQTEDIVYTRNLLLDALKLDEYEERTTTPVPVVRSNRTTGTGVVVRPLEQILDELLDDACARHLIENTVAERDLLDTRLMNCMMPRPSEVIRKFSCLYAESPARATDWYYRFSQDSNYIRRYRIVKDIKWTTETKYGDLNMTINLSKPEKDPKAIAAAKLVKQTGYPKCLLCRECEGYAGRADFPARENHRIIPITINRSEWFLQYSPYSYFNEHCIVFNGKHTPMKIDRAAFGKLFDFISQFPHYMLGSNADLPIVGGSILTHDHFQGGRFEFPMAKAEIETPLSFDGYPGVKGGIVKWPLSVIRLQSENKDDLIDLSDKILGKWRAYTDADAMIFSETDGEPHNTITPITRKRGNLFEIDLVLRNNLTTPEHPDGLYHPWAELHHIKKENIGLIEVMGLAILPGRLNTELQKVGEYLVSGKNPEEDDAIRKHAAWMAELREKYGSFDRDSVDDIVKKEAGLVFEKVLECAGVYKRTEEGKAAFLRFTDSI